MLIGCVDSIGCHVTCATNRDIRAATDFCRSILALSPCPFACLALTLAPLELCGSDVTLPSSTISIGEEEEEEEVEEEEEEEEEEDDEDDVGCPNLTRPSFIIAIFESLSSLLTPSVHP